MPATKIAHLMLRNTRGEAYDLTRPNAKTWSHVQSYLDVVTDAPPDGNTLVVLVDGVELKNPGIPPMLPVFQLGDKPKKRTAEIKVQLIGPRGGVADQLTATVEYILPDGVEIPAEPEPAKPAAKGKAKDKPADQPADTPPGGEGSDTLAGSEG